jgi:enoyl-CoA hydratase/carnithine racemase
MGLVDVSNRGPIVTLTLNRPERRNAMTKALCDALVGSLGKLREDSSVRTVVLRGAGCAFCAGADLDEVSRPTVKDFLASLERALTELESHVLPVIASIHGAATGAGLQLAAACDFRVAASDASLGIPSSRLGIVVTRAGVERLVKHFGIVITKEMLMAARTFSGTEAAQAGLVNQSVVPDLLDAEVRKLAASIAELAPLSVQGAKKTIQSVAEDLPKRLEPELDRLVVQAYESSDLSEGLAAMKEKRPPRFKGT